MISELTIRVVHAEAAEYAVLDIAQTLPFWTLSYIERGRVEIEGGVIVEAGGLMIHRPHERFNERACGPGLHRFVLLEVGGVAGLDLLPESFPIHARAAYVEAFGNVQRADPLAAACLLTIVLREFERSGRSGRDPRPPGRFAPAIERMRRDRVSRRELADLVGLDPGHFDRAFRAEYGESPMTMARRFRLERLRRDLLVNSAPLESLAFRHGFSEASALIRFFVREAGETPGAYRERADRSIGRYIGSFAPGEARGILNG